MNSTNKTKNKIIHNIKVKYQNKILNKKTNEDNKLSNKLKNKFRKSYSDKILKYKYIISALIVVLISLSLLFIQIGGIQLTLTDEKYIEAGLDLANSLPTAPPSSYARIVIIIEPTDVISSIENSNAIEILNELIKIDETLTFAITPSLPSSSEIVNAAYTKEHDIILHVPYNSIRSMNKDQIHSYLDKAFSEMPAAAGINSDVIIENYNEEPPLEHILSYLKLKNKFLINNDFTVETLGNPVANTKKQIKNAAKHAQKSGLAIINIHIGAEDGIKIVEAISEMFPWLAKNNVHIIGATDIMR